MAQIRLVNLIQKGIEIMMVAMGVMFRVNIQPKFDLGSLVLIDFFFRVPLRGKMNQLPLYWP